ncbi:MAG: TIGR04282 family arsenosugar biosynthesis glycosyltransferase [Bryobacteraceae bacterium]
MKPLIAVFAKAPIPGRVKTRLVPPLTTEQAAQLHERLVADVWQRLPGDAQLELHTDLPTAAWPGISSRRLQASGDLGARLFHALQSGLAEGHPRVAVVGGDIPDFPTGYMERLLSADADVALGPTLDGGYYAIACRRVSASMFDRVRWSSAHALADTIAACTCAGLTIFTGAPWHDVDRPEDLDLLPPHLRL